MSMNEREQLAKDNGMTIEFVNWFFDNKKDGCGNVWFMMMAAMWEGWSGREAKCAALAAENAGLKKYICDECYVENVRIGHYACAGQGMPSTTATDAYLAEVRVHGVESFLSFCGEENSVFIEKKAYYRSLADAVDEFAAQLRKGASA